MNIYVLLLLCSANVVRSKADSIDNVQNTIITIINETAPNFTPCNGNLLQTAVFGDLIEIKRHGYFHWSVFVSNETVIQLNNPEFNKLTVENAFDNFTGQVELRNLIQLAGRDHCRINNKLSESKRKNLRILSSFEILVKMKEEFERTITYYNLVNYNCEHFATKLKFGVAFSSQIEAAKEIYAMPELFRETVTEMFKVAATLNSTSNENIVDISKIVKSFLK